MRKFLFFLLFIPMFASLGHDLYIFKENPDKGFRLSALGGLWDKYHKESHDQWKTKVREVTDTVSDTVDDLAIDELINTVIPEKPPTPDTTAEEKDPPPFMEEFTQTDSKDNEPDTKPLEVAEVEEVRADSLMKFIGFVLEQKAVFVFAALAAIAYILNAILSRLCRRKEGMDNVKSAKNKKRKGGGYAYSKK